MSADQPSFDQGIHQPTADRSEDPAADRATDRAADRAADPGPDLRVAVVARRVHPAHGPGGLERHVFELVSWLATAGVAVDLVTETPKDTRRAAALSEVAPERLVVHWVPDRWLPLGRPGTVVLDRITNYPAWSLRVARWMARMQDVAGPRRWHVVHAHGLAGWGLARHPVAPMVMSPHGMEEFQVPAGLKRLAYLPFRRGMRRVAAASYRVVAGDRALVPLIERHLGVPPDRQVTIPTAVDLEACRRQADPERGEALLERLGLAGASPLFVSVGRVAANKGFAHLAAALGRAAGRLPPGWGWVLAGDGPSLAEVREMAGAVGISERCAFTGAVSDADLHALLSVADWFVHPTLYEGQSLATLEAMAHGLPVIVTRAGGLPDKVVDGVTGFLVPPGDEEALAEALVRSRQVDATAMGAAGRQLCEEGFSWPASVRSYLELYRAAAATSAGRERKEA